MPNKPAAFSSVGAAVNAAVKPSYHLEMVLLCAAGNTFAGRVNSVPAMQRSEVVPVALILPFSADSTTSAHYTSWRIRQRLMGGEEKMRNAKRCCRTVICRGLDHSHWFFCLSVCSACRVEHSGGRCSHCRWLLCGQRGSLTFHTHAD